MNNFTAIANLGADPEILTINGREIAKLRLAEKAPGKKAVTRWFSGLFGGPDVETAGRLRKGDQILVTGQISVTEYKPKKPRYKGEMMTSDEMPFGKILQVLKSETFFNAAPDEDDQEPGEPEPDAAATAAAGSDAMEDL